MSKTLIIYASNDGQTLKICQRLQTLLKQKSHAVTLVSVNEDMPMNLHGFDKVVVGASIKYGKHAHKVRHFINQNNALLATKPSAFFSVNLVARKADKNTPETNPYMKKFIQKLAWEPNRLAVFAGKLDYPRYALIDRIMIQLIMWMTKGPTDPSVTVEYTDWEQVENFAKEIESL